MTIDWSDPAAHNRLIEHVGHDEYNRLHAEQMARSTVATVNGHAIRKVQSRFGKLYFVAAAAGWWFGREIISWLNVGFTEASLPWSSSYKEGRYPTDRVN
jgi:hypothetical protein